MFSQADAGRVGVTGREQRELTVRRYQEVRERAGLPRVWSMEMRALPYR